ILFKKIVEMRENKSILEKKLEKLEKEEKNLIELKNRKNSINGSLKEIKFTLEKYKEISNENMEEKERQLKDVIKKLNELELEIRNKRKLCEELIKFVSTGSAKLNSFEESISKINKKIEESKKIKDRIDEIEKKYTKDIKSLIDKIKLELDQDKKNLSETKIKIEQIKDSLFKISDIKGECPVCKSKITPQKKEELSKEYTEAIERYQKLVPSLENSIDNKIKEISHLEKVSIEYEILKDKIREINLYEDELVEKTKSVEALKKTLEGKNSELENLRNDIESYEKNMNELRENKKIIENQINKIIEFKEKNKRKSELEIEITKIEKEIKEIEIKFNEDELRRIRNEFIEVTKKISENETNLKNFEFNIKEKNKRLNEYREKIKKIEENIKEVERLEKLIKNLSIFEKALEKTQIELRENFIESVNYMMEKIWPELYSYSDITSVRLTVKDKDYVLQMRKGSGDWVDVDGIASGGERTTACLALRIAFSSVLAPQLKWIFLDEPTHNLDAKSVEDLSQTLRERIGEFAEQIFLITHDRTLENAVTGQLYRLSRDKDLDGSTIVEKVN
ncbi:MAG: hypothetical protein QXY45_03610, partial [Candidatus Aenigmatarchaeota archaeon]